MTNISFGSSFRLNIPVMVRDFSNQFEGRSKLLEMAEDNDISVLQVQTGGRVFRDTLVAPDNFDADIESICQNYGISYKKIDAAKMLQPESIWLRTEAPKTGARMFKVKLNVENFENILKNQSSNFEHCKNMYNRYYKEDAMNILKTADKIPAPTLYIENLMASGVDEYIEKYGKKSLNKDSLSLWFTQNSDDPNHCLYFAMKELGMKEIPVCVNQETLDLCKTLGLVD